MNIIKEMNGFRSKYGSGFFKGVITFVLNSIAYTLRIEPLRGPLYAGFDLTYRCQARCGYCDRWKTGLEKREEISTKKALEMVRELGRMGTWMLSIGGGEPLLRKDIFQIIKEAKRQGMVTNLNTNGLLVKKMAKKIIESGVDSISISVESHTSEKHDSIRGLKGLFRALQEGIEEIKRHRRGMVPSIKIRFDINKINYLDLEEYIKFWEKKVDEIILQPIHEDVTNAFIISDEMRFSKDDEKRYRDQFKRLRKRYAWLKNAYYDEFENFFFSRKRLARRYRCYAGYFSIQINPDMDVFPCTAFVYKVGNLKKQDIRQIWKSDKLKRFRAIARKRKNRCFCWYNCNGTLNCYLEKSIGRLDLGSNDQ